MIWYTWCFLNVIKKKSFCGMRLIKKILQPLNKNKNTLLKYAQAGLASLDTMKSFEGDNSLITNCRSMLKFYISEVNDKMGTVSDYLFKKRPLYKNEN